MGSGHARGVSLPPTKRSSLPSPLKSAARTVAVLARHHRIPFYAVAPSSTLDAATATGAAIPIEERDGAEITTRFAARNPAFDVTPRELITAIVTEDGIT